MKKYSLFWLACLFFAAANTTAVAQLVRPLNTEPAHRKQTKPDYVADALKKLTEVLELDSFQQAVVKGELENAKSEEEKILSVDIPSESKTEGVTMLRQKLDEAIQKILTPEQKEKFTAYKDKLAKKKK